MTDIASTIRVGLTPGYYPEWGGIGVSHRVIRGIAVPHRAANIKDATSHYVAAPPRVVHTQRFAPNRIPRGVDLTITLPHDCANHLVDVEEVARGF